MVYVFAHPRMDGIQRSVPKNLKSVTFGQILNEVVIAKLLHSEPKTLASLHHFVGFVQVVCSTGKFDAAAFDQL